MGVMCYFQIPSFGSVTEVIPSAEGLPTVHINILDKESTAADLKVIIHVVNRCSLYFESVPPTREHNTDSQLSPCGHPAIKDRN